jgi:hypothetical protein
LISAITGHENVVPADTLCIMAAAVRQDREGAEYFTDPAGAAQRRYEALRAYFLDKMPAAEVADRFGYSTASVHQMATLLRKGRLALFTETRPGPKGQGRVVKGWAGSSRCRC